MGFKRTVDSQVYSPLTLMTYEVYNKNWFLWIFVHILINIRIKSIDKIDNHFQSYLMIQIGSYCKLLTFLLSYSKLLTLPLQSGDTKSESEILSEILKYRHVLDWKNVSVSGYNCSKKTVLKISDSKYQTDSFCVDVMCWCYVCYLCYCTVFLWYAR